MLPLRGALSAPANRYLSQDRPFFRERSRKLEINSHSNPHPANRLADIRKFCSSNQFMPVFCTVDRSTPLGFPFVGTS
jgi:hypothetical protein